MNSLRRDSSAISSESGRTGDVFVTAARPDSVFVTAVYLDGYVFAAASRTGRRRIQNLLYV
ncbi:MAG: hypothetical protein ACOYJI_04610 [Anaerovoracaceae bacterium]